MLKGQKSQISYSWTSSWQHTFKSQTTNGSEWECKSETQVKWFLNKLSTPPSSFFLSLCLVRILDSTWETFTVTIFVRTMAMWRGETSVCVIVTHHAAPWQGDGGNKQENRRTRPSHNTHSLIAGPYNGMPRKVVGMYILLADDTEPGWAINIRDLNIFTNSGSPQVCLW